MTIKTGLAALALLLTGEGAAVAQSVERPTLYLDALTDDRRRGLSWSGGDAAVSAGAVLPLGPSFQIDGAVTTARGSDRHGDADATVDLGGRYVHDIGAFRLTAGAAAHVFPGSTDAPGWGEVTAGAGFLFGPLQLDLSGAYAPDQSAIGGDNLHLALDARAGIPVTPITVRAGVGRSSGSVDDPVRAQRLRPDGTYWNWRLGAEWVDGPIVFGVDYHGNDIGRVIALSPLADRRHSGDVLVGRVGISF